jgi:hypothetical protein
MARLLPADTALITPRTSTTLRFDWLMVLLALFLASGTYVDAWAHNHGYTDSSFFTPSHAVLYGAFFCIAITVVVMTVPKLARGVPWFDSVPIGYEILPIGTALFACAGAGDFLWHTLFGLENGIEALLSPPHLGLVAGALLIIGAPLRAAWLRPGNPAGWREWMPPLLSLSLLLTIITFILQFAHPWVLPVASLRWHPPTDLLRFYRHGLGVIGLLLHTAIVIGAFLLLIRRWRLPFPACCFILVTNALFASVLDDIYWAIPVAAVGGIVGDLFLRSVSTTEPAKQHMFALLLPVTLTAVYFIAIAGIEGTWWTMHLVGGCVILAGATGVALSYLVTMTAHRTGAKRGV